RSPLTNIIGFADFLADPVAGPLTAKQREYLSYITVSTNALLAIINNILDLATIDAGAMTLSLGSVDIRKTMETAAEGVQDRLVRDPFPRLAASRRRPRPIAGALLRRVACRDGNARLRRRPRHYRHLHFPARRGGRTDGGVIARSTATHMPHGHLCFPARGG